jgi:hypothetical protein
MTTLALNILDIVQNSIFAGSDEIKIEIRESVKDDIMVITITDNGKGISPAMISKVTDPFTTSRKTRKIGMGLPLLEYHSKLAGGKLEIFSGEGKGTVVRSSFLHSHIDRQPLGDIPGVLIILIASNPEISFIYSHETDSGSYCFSTEEVRETLGAESINDYSLLKDLKEMISQNLMEISVSELN